MTTNGSASDRSASDILVIDASLTLHLVLTNPAQPVVAVRQIAVEAIRREQLPKPKKK